MIPSAITPCWPANTLSLVADGSTSDLPDTPLPHQAGWLYGSAPCKGHAIPVRRVAAHSQGGALAPATLSTQAPAARKRGGGLARRVLLTLSLAGRPSMPEGGAIKSLCCAAAGLFLTAHKARAGATYPTTSVRGAQKNAASLRSYLAPHAQPVEGYEHVQPFTTHHQQRLATTEEIR